MIILTIETSCDETAISILKSSGGLKNPTFEILSNIVASQVKLHSRWGGVVPSLAKREHQKNLIPVLEKALQKAELLKQKTKNKKQNNLQTILRREPRLAERLLEFLWEHQEPKIDLIAVTQGPGLEPALWTGINFAKMLALVWDKPLVAVNHMEGHLFSVFLKKNFKFQISNFKFPAVLLLVSGGHTQLVLIKNWLNYKIIGETLDDAAGEAFDKVARMLGLGYPGGPAISAEAVKFKKPSGKTAGGKTLGVDEKTPSVKELAVKELGDKIQLPRPMINSKDFNFSFSGLKTAVLYKIKKLGTLNENLKAEIAAEFQQAVIDALLKKTIKAAKNHKAQTIILGGGVAANKELRKQLKFSVKKELPDSRLLFPELKFTGDNAAMIGAAAYFRAKKKEFANLSKLKADGNLKLC